MRDGELAQIQNAESPPAGSEARKRRVAAQELSGIDERFSLGTAIAR
jgi:hypothetical protein